MVRHDACSYTAYRVSSTWPMFFTFSILWRINEKSIQSGVNLQMKNHIIRVSILSNFRNSYFTITPKWIEHESNLCSINQCTDLLFIHTPWCGRVERQIEHRVRTQKTNAREKVKRKTEQAIAANKWRKEEAAEREDGGARDEIKVEGQAEGEKGHTTRT